MDKQPVLTGKKNTCLVDYQGCMLKFSGDFDSGNLNSAELRAETEEIVISMGRDKGQKGSSKTWFYFSVEGRYNDLTVKLLIDKANVIYSFVNKIQTQAKVYDLYRPVIKVEGQTWKRLPTPVDLQIVQGDVRMRFKLQLTQSKKVYIALIYPWSFEDNDFYMSFLEASNKNSPNIYFNKETIVYSYEKRPIHLLAISSAEVKNNKTEEYIDHLFPLRDSQTHFKYSNKPIILITARVHPGEVGSSHAMNGMLEFLTGTDEIAIRLRKEYYFLIIPMLNPDGVSNGHNRMDSLGQNLNRFYHLPDIEKQPSCFAVKSLVQATRRQIFAFFDLHGHANKKSCFLYGNSIPLTRLQGQSILYAKLLSMNCAEIDFNSCNFSKKQMSSKDKNEDMSKEGCARVVVHRWSNSPYCYTLQTGLHKNVKIDDKGIERYGEDFYSIRTYQDIGVSMLTTFHQLITGSKKIDELRKEMIGFAGRTEKFIKVKEDVKKKEGIPVTLKQFKFDEGSLTEARGQSYPGHIGLPALLPRPEKENTKKPHSLQSVDMEKVKMTEEALHLGKKKLLMAMENNKDSDD